MGRSRNATLRAQHALTDDELVAADGGVELAAVAPDYSAAAEPADELRRNGQTDG